MATKSHTTFKKRQKEMERAEKQREKAARRLEKKSGEREPEPEMKPLTGPPDPATLDAEFPIDLTRLKLHSF